MILLDSRWLGKRELRIMNADEILARAREALGPKLPKGWSFKKPGCVAEIRQLYAQGKADAGVLNEFISIVSNEPGAFFGTG